MMNKVSHTSNSNVLGFIYIWVAHVTHFNHNSDFLWYHLICFINIFSMILMISLSKFQYIFKIFFFIFYFYLIFYPLILYVVIYNSCDFQTKDIIYNFLYLYCIVFLNIFYTISFYYNFFYHAKTKNLLFILNGRAIIYYDHRRVNIHVIDVW